MEPWLKAALGYIPQWLGHQMRLAEQPGAVLAIAHKGKLVFEQAFGKADIARGALAAPPLPRRLPFQELHRRRHSQAA